MIVFFQRCPHRSAVPIASVALLFAAVGACHGSFSVPFSFDDVVAIGENASIRDVLVLGGVLLPPMDGSGVLGRPLVNLSLAVNYAIGGTNVAGYHVFNLVV